MLGILNYVVLLVLGVFAGFIYTKTGSYNKNMVISLAILPLLVYCVLSAVNGNMGASIAVLGVFSLIRFRSVPGTSRDIIGVFYSMTIGILALVGIIYCISLGIVLGIIIFLLYKSKLGKEKTLQQLKILIPENLNYNGLFEDLFEEYLDYVSLDKVKLTNMGTMFELDYLINIKSNVDEKKFLDEIRCKNGNLNISLNKVLKNDLTL